MSSALVFSIEEFSVFDGPGIRTTVFLKGCPLRCEWCHNPEGQTAENNIVRSPNGCVHCGECLRYAKQNGEQTEFTEESIAHCPNNLLRYCAQEYSAEQLCAKLEKNFEILNQASGGVTFSGGEPTSNGTFLSECLALLKGKIHRAVQTCGYCPPKTFARILENCDYMLFDLKLIDEQAAIRYTGVSDRLILQNFKTLSESGKPFVIRTPLIPTVTDTENNLTDIAKLLAENGISYIELLPYNKMSGAKYRLAGKKYQPSFDESIPVCPRIDLFARYGITAKLI